MDLLNSRVQCRDEDTLTLPPRTAPLMLPSVLLAVARIMVTKSDWTLRQGILQEQTVQTELDIWKSRPKHPMSLVGLNPIEKARARTNLGIVGSMDKVDLTGIRTTTDLTQTTKAQLVRAASFIAEANKAKQARNIQAVGVVMIETTPRQDLGHIIRMTIVPEAPNTRKAEIMTTNIRTGHIVSILASNLRQNLALGIMIPHIDKKDAVMMIGVIGIRVPGIMMKDVARGIEAQNIRVPEIMITKVITGVVMRTEAQSIRVLETMITTTTTDIVMEAMIIIHVSHPRPNPPKLP